MHNREWPLFILILLVLAVFATQGHAAEPDLKQDTLDYCNARAALALNITRSMEQGYTTAQINIGWERAPESDAMAEGREQWVAALKEEIDAAAALIARDKDEWAQRVAQKIIERCWYDYGKRKTEKRTALDAGFLRAASSEAIAKPALAKPSRYDECSHRLADEVFIGNMLGSGRGTADELRTLALTSRAPLTPEHLQKVLALIDAADTAQQQGALQAWFDRDWHACLNGAQ